MSESVTFVAVRSLDERLNDYLFGTNITLKWLEQTLQRIFNTSSTFGALVSAERIGVRQGHLSVMVRIRFDWQGNDSNRLPESLVLKIPSTAHFKKDLDVWEAVLSLAHSTEVALYELLQGVDRTALRIPKCYGCQDFEPNGQPGFLLFDDLCDVGAIKPFYKQLSVDALKQVMENLASLHSFSLTNGDFQNNLQLKSSFFEMYNKDIVTGRKQLLQYIDVLIADNMEYFGSSLNRLRAFIENNNNQPYSAISIHGDMDIPLVLTHGDLYKFNIMWKKTGKDDETSDELIAFVDYQNAHVGSIGEDLMHLFCTSVSAQTRRAHFDELIDHYYASLTAKLRTTPPFTTAQMKTAFWRFFPFALVMLLPIWRGFSAEKCFHLIGKKNPELKRRMMLEIVKCAVEDWYKHVDETEADHSSSDLLQ